MQTLRIPAVVILLALACAAPVFPAAGEYEKGQVPGYWPAGLADLLNSQEWVYAYWFSMYDYFYYSGDTDAFNAFLKRYAQLAVTPHVLVLHWGYGSVKRLNPVEISSDKTPDQNEIAFDWAVTGECWGGGQSQGRALPAVVNVELYLGWHVNLADAVVPPGVELRFADDLSADSLRRLEPPLGRRTAEGKFSCDGVSRGLLLGAGAQGERNIVRLLSIKFERAQDSGIQAAIDTVMLSGPKGKWSVRLDLLDAERRTLATGEAVFENSGAISSYPAKQLGTLQLRIAVANPLGTLQLDLSPTGTSEPLNVERVASFRVSISEADPAAKVTTELKTSE